MADVLIVNFTDSHCKISFSRTPPRSASAIVSSSVAVAGRASLAPSET
jgi:hypothetical protein